MGSANLNTIIALLKASTNIFRLSNAQEKLRKWESMKAAIEAMTPMEIAEAFHLPLSKREQAINRLTLQIEEQKRYIKWLENLPDIGEAGHDAMTDAWNRDVATWSAQGGNCD